jgi:hypothetical protein
MFKSILFGAFCFTLWSLVAISSLFLGGCGGGEDTTVVLNMPAEQCVAGHHEACWCEGGATGYQVCRDDGMAYGHCQCTELPTVDAGAETSVEDSDDTSCGPDQPVGHVIGSNCCDDGSTGYMVCQASGLYEGCWGCQLESDAGNEDVVFVQLAATNPEGKILCDGENMTAITFNVINTSESEQNLRSLRLHKIGTSPNDIFAVGGISGNYVQLAVPDSSGYVTFDNMNMAISAQTSLMFAYWVQVDSPSAAASIFAIELENKSALTFNGNVQVQGTFPVRGNYFTLSDAPCSEIDAGTDAEADAEMDVDAGADAYIPVVNQLSFQLSAATPQSTILIAGVGTDKLFSIYSLSNGTNHPVTFDRVGVQEICSDGFSCKKNVSCLVAEVKGFKMSTSVLDPIGVTQIPPVVNGESVTLQPGESADVRISACLQGLMPHSIQGADLPRSGDSLYLQLFSVFHGDELVAFPEGNIGLPNAMVVRKSKPVVTPQQLTNTAISSGERLLASWQVGAGNAGSIAIKQFPFRTECTDGMFLSNFRLYRGSVPMSLNTYSIMDMSTGADLKTTTVGGPQDTFPTVAFVGEEFASDNGNVYSLRATLSFNGGGHHVKTKFINPGSGNITGGLVNNVALLPPEVAGSDLWHVQEPGGGYGVGTFLWSDLSEVPHSTSSYDWTTGHLVENLDHVWILTN